MRTFRYDRRPAFTLVELLVVIAIIGVLAGLAIYFVPSIQTSERAARGGANLQSWLQAARQRAIRDQAPRGLRILFDPTTGLASKCQYLEQPDDLGSGRYWDSKNSRWMSLALHASPDSQLNKVWVKDSDGNPAFNFGANFSVDPTVQAGDYLELDGVALPRFIFNTEQSDKTKPIFDMLVLASNLPEGLTNKVTNFRISRAPRVTGDETIDLPKSVVVDGKTNGYYAGSGLTFLEALPADALGNLDIMFSPTGSVLQGKFSKQHIVLWLRSTDEDSVPLTVPTDYFRGEPTLIVIYINSGLVAAYPVNSGNVTNPYDLVK
jgi:prepilin-type N-terminal cleavage/methylation domain-containing protein